MANYSSVERKQSPYACYARDILRCRPATDQSVKRRGIMQPHGARNSLRAAFTRRRRESKGKGS